ncbi:hypothetical protein GCM10023097_61240 [Streptomyces collinus]|uniref:Uncharacterized protein n=1 Tax=Streptomyces collinus TaxID=42684 RepID=A0AA89Q2B6_STRCU|nr:hypothetical protein [Streptomyces collinus]
MGRHVSHEHLVAGLASALRAGGLTADAVALEAERGRRPKPTRSRLRLFLRSRTGRT